MDTPELKKCPNCRHKSLFWNNQLMLYECLNLQCRHTFSRSDPNLAYRDTTDRETPPQSPTEDRPSLEECPRCRAVSLFWNKGTEVYECLNPNCKGRFIPEDLHKGRGPTHKAGTSKAYKAGRGKKWLILLGIAAVVLVGVSLIMTVYADSRITTAQEDGTGEGEAQGYSDGYDEGGATGYTVGTDTGYHEGDTKGYETGLTEGYSDGDEDGYAQGYPDGHTEGERIGYEAGREEGYASGDTDGYEPGREEGYTSGDTAGYETGREEGHASGYATGFEEGIGTDYLVRNPTYNEVQEMLGQSEAFSAWEINNDFEAKRIRTGYVFAYVAAWPDSSYSLVAFETVDNGLVYIRPASHEEVQLEVGRRYYELLGFSVPDWDDTITRITIVW